MAEGAEVMRQVLLSAAGTGFPDDEMLHRCKASRRERVNVDGKRI